MGRMVQLEKAAEKVCMESAKCPRIYQLPPKEGREVLERTQDSPVQMYPAKVEARMVMTECWGRIPVYYIMPENLCSPVHVIYYIHGAGWVFGSFHTHEKLVRELAARTGCMVVFPEYTRSPEVKYPIAVEQCYAVLCALPRLIADFGYRMNSNTLTVAGDSSGGNLAIAMTLLSKWRSGPYIQKQLLYYPVTNACFHTESYCMFANDYYLYRDGMIWFWNQYTDSLSDRDLLLTSPLRAEVSQLCGLPQAMIINGEADVLRDEGEAFARKLRLANVAVTAVRFQAIIHDFVMLNSLDQTQACRAAMDLSTEWIFLKNMQAEQETKDL